jgi:Tol biopolymer transport system component
MLDADLSRDGSRAVFARLILPTRTDAGGSDLYTVSVAGGEPSLLLAHDMPGATLTTPVWSADGASVLYTYTPFILNSTGPETLPRIERIPAAGGPPTVVATEALSPAPSSDGRLLAFMKTSNRGDALWVANADGSDGREVLSPTRFLGIAYPRISPDGTQIALAATIDLPTAPGPGLPNGPSVPNGPTAPRSPFDWRPASATAHGLPWDIWLMNLDGSNLRRLTYMVEDDPSIAWSPDGRWLAVQGGYGLTLVDASSGRTDRVARQEAFGAIGWAPE